MPAAPLFVLTLFAVSAAPAPAPALGGPPAPPAELLELGRRAAERAAEDGLLAKPELVTLIDYRLPSTEPRLWVVDLERGEVLFRELVAHGRNTGENEARRFSNRVGSKQTSLGAFVTAETYTGANGYSLRLDGLEEGVNDRARERAIVLHGAWYVSEELARRQGRIGRSWGCPAVREEIARELIDTIAGGSLLLSFHEDPAWLAGSRFVGPEDAGSSS